MATTYKYELRRSGKIVGYATLSYPILGQHLVVRESSAYKQRYGTDPKMIKFPLGWAVTDDGVTRTSTRYLDVTRKSDRQIEILKRCQ